MKAAASCPQSTSIPKLPAGKLVSDAAITVGLLGWAGITAAALGTRQPKLAQALGFSAAVYVLGGGSIKHGDPVLVAALKDAFARVRPSVHHQTYSFPRCMWW
jgi:hypothetical protein